MDFDTDRIYYSHQNLASESATTSANEPGNDEERPIDSHALRRHYREFLRNYRQGNRYIYRDRLLRAHRRHHPSLENSEAAAAGGTDIHPTTGTLHADWNPNQSYIHVDLAHVGEYDAALLSQLLERSSEALPVFEVAAADALRTLSYHLGRKDDLDEEQDRNPNDGDGGGDERRQSSMIFTGNSIQILLRGNLTPTPLRSIQSRHMNHLLKCPGIIVSAARSRPRAMCLKVRCGKCMDVRTVFGNSTVSGSAAAGDAMVQLGSSSPFSGFSLPSRCLGPNPQGTCSQRNGAKRSGAT